MSVELKVDALALSLVKGPLFGFVLFHLSLIGDVVRDEWIAAFSKVTTIYLYKVLNFKEAPSNVNVNLPVDPTRAGDHISWAVG